MVGRNCGRRDRAIYRESFAIVSMAIEPIKASSFKFDDNISHELSRERKKHTFGFFTVSSSLNSCTKKMFKKQSTE